MKETHQGCLSRAIVRPQATFLQSYYGLIAKMPQLVDKVYSLTGLQCKPQTEDKAGITASCSGARKAYLAQERE